MSAVRVERLSSRPGIVSSVSDGCVPCARLSRKAIADSVCTKSPTTLRMSTVVLHLNGCVPSSTTCVSSARAATGTWCGARAHSLSSTPFGVPSIGRSSSVAGTCSGARPRSDAGSQRAGSSSTPVSRRRTAGDASACSRLLEAKKSKMSGSRRYGTVSSEISSSLSAWPSVPSNVGSDGMCSTSVSLLTRRPRPSRSSLGDASVPHRSPLSVGSGSRLPSRLVRRFRAVSAPR